jgi:hypothetical protein
MQQMPINNNLSSCASMKSKDEYFETNNTGQMLVTTYIFFTD